MLKATEERKQAKRAEVKKSIIEIATLLIKDQTFTKISIQDFCDLAGITTGMFYRHFKTKNDLLAVVYADENKNTVERMMEEIKELPLQEQLIRYAMTLCRASEMLGPDGLLMYLHSDNTDNVCEELRSDMEKAIERIIEQAKNNGEMLPDGKTAEIISNDLALLLKGAIFEWYSWGDAFDIARTMESVFRRLMPAILYN